MGALNAGGFSQHRPGDGYRRADAGRAGTLGHRLLNTGTYISGAGHAALILWVLFGGLFRPDPLPLEVSEVQIMSERGIRRADGALAAARKHGGCRGAPGARGRTGAGARADSATCRACTGPAARADPDRGARAGDRPGRAPTPPPPAEVTDAPPVMEPPADEAVPLPETSSPPAASPAPRVAPEPVAPPEPDADVAPDVQEAVVPDEAPTEVDRARARTGGHAPEAATSEIVTEATSRRALRPMPRCARAPGRTARRPHRPPNRSRRRRRPSRRSRRPPRRAPRRRPIQRMRWRMRLRRRFRAGPRRRSPTCRPARR